MKRTRTRRKTGPKCDCGGKLAGGNHLCAECATKLDAALSELAALPSLLSTVATKQSRSAPAPRTRHGKDTPLPYNPDALTAIHRIDDTLARWVDLCNRGEPWPTPGTEPEWLAARLARIEQAGRALDELRGLADRSRDLIDIRGAVIFCGPCTVAGCTAPLYRRRGDQQITCLACNSVYETADRMKWLRDQLVHQVLPAGLLVEALGLLGHTVTENRIKVWAHRGRIPRRGTEGAPRYAVADAVELLVRQRDRKTPGRTNRDSPTRRRTQAETTGVT